MSSVNPEYSADLQGKDAKSGGLKAILIGIVLAVICCGSFAGSYFFTNWKCDQNAPASTHGPDFLPRNVTLDESAAGAMAWFGGRSVDVFAGSGQKARVPGEPLLGSFVKVWTWWGQRFGYVEHTPQGLMLRFTASQSWPWVHSKWVIEPCDQGKKYDLAREGSLFGSFDGTFHNVWVKTPSGDVKLATADHQMNGLNVGAGLFTGVDLNVKWSIVFKAVEAPQPPAQEKAETKQKARQGRALEKKQPTVLAQAYQWYDQNLIANYGVSNWAVSSVSQSEVPVGVTALPAHIVAYTAALYDLNIGSDRRRRSGRVGKR